MKKILLACSIFLLANAASAQCGTCTPDPVCLAQQPRGVCDSILPDGMVSVAYQHDVSFFMKAKVDDAATKAQCSCSHVDLDSIRFQGASNLPPGITVEFNSPTRKYYPTKGDSTGCVRFCGTPVAPGSYVVRLNFLADVTVRGISVIGDLVVKDQQQFYTVYINIQPDTSGNVSTFSFGGGPRTTCDSSLTFDFQALLAAQAPNLTTYAWNFDNGTGSNQKQPGMVTYATPDTFNISLLTRFLNYRIKTVYVDVKGGYTGDIEELTTVQNPDPYIKFNQLGFSNRGSRSDVKKTQWLNLNLEIPEGTDSLSIEVWDEDTGPPQGTNPLGSPDDLLINTKVKVSLDTARFSNNNVSGFVTFDTILANSVAETLKVIIHPSLPVPVLPQLADTFCLGQVTTLKAAGYKDCTFQWFDGGAIMPQETDSVLSAFYSGNYSVSVTNLKTGCSTVSAEKALTFIPSPPDSLEIVQLPDGRLVNNNYPNADYGIQWYKNGQPVSGLTIDDFILTPDGQGFYSCEVWHKQFPACRSISQLFLFTSVADVAASTVLVYPNPFSSEIVVELPAAPHRLLLTDLQGKVLVETTAEGTARMGTQGIAKGVYLLMVQHATGNFIQKVIKQ